MFSLPDDVALALDAVHADVESWTDSRRSDVASAVGVEPPQLIEFLEAGRVSVRYRGWRPLTSEKALQPRRGGRSVLPVIIGCLRALLPSAEMGALCISYTSLSLTTLIFHENLDDDAVEGVTAAILLLIRVLLSKDGQTGKLSFVFGHHDNSTKSFQF